MNPNRDPFSQPPIPDVLRQPSTLDAPTAAKLGSLILGKTEGGFTLDPTAQAIQLAELGMTAQMNAMTVPIGSGQSLPNPKR
jgi:hypothetical protein